MVTGIESDNDTRRSAAAAIDPMALFRDAFARADVGGRVDPRDAALATATSDGRPAVRIVRTSHDARGFLFSTDLGSRKAADLVANPRAALTFYWPTTAEQVRIFGTAVALSDAESDLLFAAAGRDSRLAAWASRQSAPLRERAVLAAARAAVVERFGGGEVPRPPWWAGFRLRPVEIEFCIGHDDRLHERTLFTRVGDAWQTRRLQP